MKKNMEKSPLNLGTILIRAAGVLFILTIISVYLLGGLLARYVSGGQAGDSARVAGFDVRIGGMTDGLTYEVTALTPGEIVISLDNQSEVAVSYALRIDAGHPEYGIQATVVDPNGDSNPDDNMVRKTTDDPDGEMDFGIVGYMAPGGFMDCTLQFTAVDWSQITRDKTGNSAEVTQEFVVYIDVVQVD